jgi:hypothetical protein
MGGGNDEIAVLSQQVTVNAGAPFLTYYHIIGSADDCGFDFAEVDVNGTAVKEYDLCDANETGGWVQQSVNLAAYAGQSILLEFVIETDSAANSNWFIDDVAFAASAAAAGPADPSAAPAQADAPRE